MFGAVYGDVIGSYYESHCTKNYDFELHRDCTFTDDSVLTAAVCRTILNNDDEIAGLDMRTRAAVYAAQYRQYYNCFPYAGFGSMFSAWAKSGGYGTMRSYGNGAAMRAVPIGCAYRSMEQVLLQAKASAFITHHHREAIHGAQAVAASVFMAKSGESKEAIRSFISRKFGYKLNRTVNGIRPEYTFDSRTSYSVPPAIIAFLDSDDYESAVRNAVSLGGDADTMACIAGGIAQVYYGSIPDHIERFCRHRVDTSIRTLVREFEQRYFSIQ